MPVSLQTSRIYDGPLPPVSLTTAPNTVLLSGTITMNVPCYRFSATARWQHDTLLVSLVATGTSEICLQVVAFFFYSITVSGVRSGTVPVRLIYDRYGVPQYLETALEQTAQVT